jgi:thiosulfate/3-mercaptopyruvate sulfurtransferase
VNSAIIVRQYIFYLALILFSSFISSAYAISSNSSLFIEAEELVKIMDDPDTLILDVRDEKQYKQKHIKQAVNLAIKKTFNPTNRTDKVGTFSYIQDLFSNSGIDLNTHVVIYDEGIFINAARMFWVLQFFGHNKVRVLNGGFPAWQHQSFPQSTLAFIPQRKNFQANIQPEHLASKFNVRIASQSDTSTLLDSRSVDEFLGKKSKTLYKGHIPLAINVPWTSNIYKDTKGISRIKARTELVKLYEKINIKKPVIAYCNKGKESTFSYLILRDMGYQVSHYDGSWFEWSNDHTLPIVKK